MLVGCSVQQKASSLAENAAQLPAQQVRSWCLASHGSICLTNLQALSNLHCFCSLDGRQVGYCLSATLLHGLDAHLQGPV
jgi:hypothetical protein